jgi:hypothetical protein
VERGLSERYEQAHYWGCAAWPFWFDSVQSAYIASQPYTGTRNEPRLAWLPGIDECADGKDT